MKYQICKKCKENKPLNIKYFQYGKNKINGIEKLYWYKTCKICDRPRILKKIKRYKVKNRQKLALKQKEYHKNNKKNDALTQKVWYQNNKEKVKLRVKKYIYKKRKENTNFKLKECISSNIRSSIKKNFQPLKKYLPYSIQELKKHLESLFEPWMNWENYGVYRINIWKDNDQATWTWQIDHIIPHSKFNYTSMEDEEFKKCWALDNLRPYSAKLNILEGARYI